jgi:ribosomal subunit interface protein
MDPMQLSITGRQIDIGDALRNHARARLSSVTGRFLDAAVDGAVNFAREGAGYRTDCTVHLRSGLYLHTHGKSPDIYAAFDQAVEKLEKRLSRHKSRIRDHHNGARGAAAPTEDATYITFAGPDDDGATGSPDPAVVAETTMQIRTLTVGEAVLQLDLADAPVVVFRNAGHGQINVVYKRGDGHIGWVDPTLHPAPQAGRR